MNFNRTLDAKMGICLYQSQTSFACTILERCKSLSAEAILDAKIVSSGIFMFIAIFDSKAIC